MAFEIEALPARYGDSIILHWGKGKAALIDGGPAKVWKDSLRDALDRLGAAQGGIPTIELLVVSHIDEDHIRGILDMTSVLLAAQSDNEPPPVKIRRAWHNSFDDLIGNDGAELVGPGGTITVSKKKDISGAVVASVNQGRRLRDDLNGLGLDGNRPFGSLVVATGDSKSVKKIAGLELTVICPSGERIAALQKDWAKKVKALKKKKATTAELAELLDKSVPNLSSIALLAEAEGTRMLLTGDARGDDIIQGLHDAGLLDDEGRIDVDILKLPHHGSDRNVDQNFFDHVTAKHYIASGDGTYGNPEVKTFEYISRSRSDDAFAVHITYPSDEFALPTAARNLEKFFATDKKKGRTYTVDFRDPELASIRI